MLVKAAMTDLESLESLDVLWNPQSYRIERTNQFAVPQVLGASELPVQFCSGHTERLSTRFFLDATHEASGASDVRRWSDAVARWSQPSTQGLPPRLMFSWGDFRFRGYLAHAFEEWTRFDSEGTPIRGWLDIVMWRAEGAVDP